MRKYIGKSAESVFCSKNLKLIVFQVLQKYLKISFSLHMTHDFHKILFLLRDGYVV